MNWESQKPKAIGTYWHADPNWNRGVVKMLDVFMTLDGDLGVYPPGADCVMWLLSDLPDTGFWAVAEKPTSPCMRMH